MISCTVYSTVRNLNAVESAHTWPVLQPLHSEAKPSSCSTRVTKHERVCYHPRMEMSRLQHPCCIASEGRP